MALIEVLRCMAYIRFDICNLFISALELFKCYVNYFLARNLDCFTSNPQRLVHLHLDGRNVPILCTFVGQHSTLGLLA